MDPIRPPDHRRRNPWFLLLLTVAAAAVLRYLGLHWGLPGSTHIFSYHPDEYHSLRGAFSILLAGDFNPHFFNYGSLYLYLAAIAAALADSPLPSVLDTASLAQVMHDWTLAARYLNLLLALLTVLVVYQAGRQLLGARVGGLAALALAVFPLHVLHSHYATVDVPQALFIALTLLFAVRIGQTASTRDYLLAGLCAGLAMSVKYNGAVVMLAPLVAHFAAPAEDRKTGLLAWQPLAMLAVMALAFAVTSPYTFLDWESARRDMFFEIQHMRVGEEPARSADPNGWLFHGLGLTLTTGGATVAALAGIIALFFNRAWRPALGVIAFGLVWFAMISVANVRYGRYEVALTPVLALLMAAGPAALGRRPARVRLAGALLPLAAIVLSAMVSIPMITRLHTEPDPRDTALAAVLKSVPPDRSVGMVWEPWFQSPPLDPLNGGQMLRNNPFWGQFSKPLRPLVITGLDGAALRREQPFGFVLSNFEIRDALRLGLPDAVELRRVLQEDYLPAAMAVREAPLANVAGWTPPQDWLYAFPEVSVYVHQEAGEREGPSSGVSRGAAPG